MCLFWIFSVILAGCSGSANQIQGRIAGDWGGTGYVTSSDGFVFSGPLSITKDGLIYIRGIDEPVKYKVVDENNLLLDIFGFEQTVGFEVNDNELVLIVDNERTIFQRNNAVVGTHNVFTGEGLKELSRRGMGKPESFNFDLDGNIVVSTSDGLVFINVKTYKIKETLSLTRDFGAFAFNPQNNNQIIAKIGTGRLQIWDIAQNQVVHELDIEDCDLYSGDYADYQFYFTPDGGQVWSVSENVVCSWKLKETEKEIFRIADGSLILDSKLVNGEIRLLIREESENLQVTDVYGSQILNINPLPYLDWFHSLTSSADFSILAIPTYVDSPNCEIDIIEANSARIIQKIDCGQYPINQMEFSNNGQLLFVLTNSRLLVYKIGSNQEPIAVQLTQPFELGWIVNSSMDGRYLLANTHPGSYRPVIYDGIDEAIYDCDTHCRITFSGNGRFGAVEESHRFYVFENDLENVIWESTKLESDDEFALSYDGQYLLIEKELGVTVYDYMEDQVVYDSTTLEFPAEVLENKDYLIAISRNWYSTLKVIDLHTNVEKEVSLDMYPDDRVIGISQITPAGTFLVVTQNGYVFWVEPRSGANDELLSSQTEVITMDINEAGDLIVLGFENGEIGIWKSGDVAGMRYITAHANPIIRVNIDEKAQKLVTVSQDGILREWRLNP